MIQQKLMPLTRTTGLWLLVALASWYGPVPSASISCLPCDHSKCAAPSNCSSGTVPDACGCCQVCAKVNGAGELCGGPQNVAGSCAAGLLCAPREQGGEFGTCRAATPCQSCYIENDGCLCVYSDQCPLGASQFATREECEATLSAQRCEGILCPFTAACPQGMVYVQRPAVPGDCCPSAGGDCVCDPAACDGDILCPVGTKRIVVKPRSQAEMVCCDVVECQPDTPVQVSTCHNGSDVFQQGDVWQVGCSNCTCLEGDRIACALPQCPPLDCIDTVVDDFGCCAVCRPNDVILETATFNVSPPPCTSSSGHVYQDGASWQESTCTACVCSGGKAFCSEPTCYLGNCASFSTPPGACCPVCHDAVPTVEDTGPTGVVGGSNNQTAVVDGSVVAPPTGDPKAPVVESSQDTDAQDMTAIASSLMLNKTRADPSPQAESSFYLLPIGLGTIMLTVFLVVGCVASMVVVRRCWRHGKHKKLQSGEAVV